MAEDHDHNDLGNSIMDKEDRNSNLSPSGSGFFEIRVKGHLNSKWSDWFENLDIRLLDNGEMVLAGSVTDQAALMGILNKLNRLNLALLSVNEASQKNNVLNRKEGDKMDNMQILNRNFERVGWGLLAILWGMVILFDFLPFEAGLVGTGLILLGVARATDRLSLKNDGTVLGILILAWSGLEFARPLLGKLLPSVDLDWVIFAILLVGLGVMWLGRGLYEPGSNEKSNL